MNRTLLICIFLIVVSVLVIGVWCVYDAVTTALRAESALHANLLVLSLVNQYIEKYDQWPDSWHDLEQLPKQERTMFDWPQDSEIIQQYVSINFDVDLDGLTRQSPEAIVDIQPIGPYYPYDDKSQYRQLLETIRNRNTEEIVP